MNRVYESKEDCKDPRFRKQVILDYISGKISRKAASIKLYTSEIYIDTKEEVFKRRR